MTYDFTDRMAAGKANALRDRNRGGGSSVKVYATTQALYRARGGNVGPGTWDYVLAYARANWRGSRLDAIEDYCRTAFPERYQEF